ncbi:MULTISPECIES: BT_3987 domain-containing protein [Alistipes]|jgi:hypothetical protein|uniref:BT_3987 domain-containing protein n=1 Tax=Alistipes TaxID=239759 RepID=UPI000EE6AA62|nr:MULTISPECIES: DUF1735 domain-containing protein [Alistipes]HCF08968.1 ABC transporter ATP-binding protein [Alistipes sp.]
MKNKKLIIRSLRSGLFGLAAAMSLIACTDEEVTYKVGQLPDEEAMTTVTGVLRSSKSLRDRVPVHLTEGDEDVVSDKIYYKLTQAAPQAMTLTAAPDLTLVEVYNIANGTNLTPLPAANIRLSNNGKIAVPAGARMSDKIELTIESKGLEPGIYLMPVVVDATENGTGKQVLYYGITVREFDENIYQDGDDLHNIELDTEWTTVFYLNTGEVQAHYADYVAWEKQDMNTFESVYRASLGNIVNLRIAQVGYDPDSKRALFSLTSDLRYTVEHADKYIRQMQDKGRKVCVCIEGGGSGLGFCNMTDAQIADFAEQVRIFITTYRLDGVNLWDRGSGYGKEGMPAVNTASYPKLIRALRAALPDKMLTVVDYEEPTESFYDTNLTDGIAVGELIDYAWHGYVSENEPIRFINPYNQFTSYEQVYSRKPFAGLEESRYGNVNVPYYSTRSDLYIDMNMDLWSMNLILWNLERQSDIIVFDDLSLPKAMDAESGCIDVIGNIYMYLAYDENFEAPYGYNVMMRIPGIYRQGSKNYDTFAKDW